MTRRRGGGRRGGRGTSPGVVPVYEGPEVLDALLRRAGSPYGAEEVAESFARAQKKGEQRSVVIPGLFPEEPRFDGPEAARRLYANLFGLWARVASGLGPRDDAPVIPEAQPRLPPLPERGAVSGDTVPGELVEAVWRHLAALSPRELQRRRDRFQNVQPDLAAWLEAVPLPEAGALAAMDLAFELWAMLDQAFGERLGAVAYRELREIEKEPPIIESTQPAIAGYVEEQLENLADEEPALGPEERALVEKAVATVVCALSAAVRLPS